jgi:hypothetical protein
MRAEIATGELASSGSVKTCTITLARDPNSMSRTRCERALGMTDRLASAGTARSQGWSKGRPVVARSGWWICGVEEALERSGRGPSTPRCVRRDIIQRSEDEVRLWRLCLRR